MTRQAFDTALGEVLRKAARDPGSATAARPDDSWFAAYDLTPEERAELAHAIRTFAGGIGAMRLIAPAAYRGQPWPFPGMALDELLNLAEAAERVARQRRPGDGWPGNTTIIRNWAEGLLVELQDRRRTCLASERPGIEAAEAKVRVLRDRS